MAKKFNVLVIGAGKIGALFDHPNDIKILTHAHAYKTNPNFEIVGFADSDFIINNGKIVIFKNTAIAKNQIKFEDSKDLIK